MGISMIYCCLEHVEQALDDVVKKFASAPVFEKAESTESDENNCGYCGKPAVYLVGNE